MPLPATVTGTTQPVISLSGQWKFTNTPLGNYWENATDTSSWRDIPVPAQEDKVGAPRSSQFAYKTKIAIPANYAGQQIFVRFEGVTGESTAWVNGTQIATHHGGFTVWDADITKLVSPGQDAWLTVSVTEPTNTTSTNTYTGGIIRGVKLLAVPPNHVTRFNVETDLDKNYQNATMKVWLALNFDNAASGKILLKLKSPSGQEVALSPAQIDFTSDHAEMIADVPVAAPVKWDAEHPNLYTLEASVVINGQTVETLVKNIGFRKVEVVGQKFLVNGHEVKLRGVGQFDSDPLTGRSLSPEEAASDILLYKSANLNFLRPACYPASDEQLDACDRYGMFVEGECPVTFAAAAAGNAQLRPIFLSQAAEMVEEDRSHPSIIIWNLANETSYGANIQAEHDYIKTEDPSRPIIFSWSHSIPVGQPVPYDIYSYHYPDYQADLGRPGVAVFNGQLNARLQIPTMPVLSDEFAHPSAYNNEELARDPNVHNFWGQSIQTFWEKMFTTEGSMGGAIWAGMDSVDGNTVYRWGLFDAWRRPKPEFWLAKKAYSPIRLDDRPVSNPGSGKPLSLPIKNWFDTTNLNEIKVVWQIGSQTGTMNGPDVKPHADGTLQIPARAWGKGDVVDVKFLSSGGMLIDEYKVAVDPAPIVLPTPQGPAPKITEDASQIVVSGPDFSLTFSKQYGMLINGTYHGDTLIQYGPYLNVLGANLGQWAPKQISAKIVDAEAVVSISGSYAPVDVSFEILVDGHGLITTQYTLDNFPIPAPATAVRPWNQTNAGGFEEVGIQYLLTGNVDSLSWSRKGLWSAYPDDHIGRNAGVAPRTGPGHAALPSNTKPGWSWAQDERDIYGTSRGGRGAVLASPDDQGTNDFRSMKENIYFASAIITASGSRVRVVSDAADAVRLQVADAQSKGVWLIINNQWNYRNLGLGNYMKPPVIITTGYTNQVRMRMTDHDGTD